MASMEEILKAIKEAQGDELKAFKEALGVTDGAPINLADNREQLEIEKSRAEVLLKSARAMQDHVEAREQEANLINNSLLLAAERAGMEEANLAAMREAIKAGQEITSITNQYGQEVADLVKQYNDVSVQQARINDLSSDHKRNIGDITDKMGDLVGLSNKFSNSFIGKMKTTLELFGDNTEEGQAALANFKDQFKTMFSLQNIAMNIGSAIFNQSKELMEAFDNASADLAKTTGTADKFTGVLYDAQRAGNLLNVTMSDVAGAIGILNSQTSNFAKLTGQTQTEIAIMATQMEKLGVSSQDTAEFMENAFKIMSMSATEATKAQTELAMAGVQLGIEAGKMVKDFNAASKVLAVYGKQALPIFKGLAAQAKAANVEVGTLLSMVQQYDTFAGAAEGASRLNALLGTQLSTTQMLMMTEDERVKTMVEQVQAQGIAFKDMDKFTQMAIAHAAGITDMNEANRIFGMSLADYEANRRELDNNAESQKKFDEAVQATVPTFEKFRNLATEMVIMIQPAMEMLGEFADQLTEFFQGLSKETKETIASIALFVSGVAVIAPLLSVGGGLVAGMAAIGPAIAGIGTGIATALGAITAVASTGFGAAVMAGLVGSGLALVGILASIAGSEADIAASNAEMVAAGGETVQAMADIGNADFSGIATNFQQVLTELEAMGSDVKVTSTLQNLALMSAGTAFDLTGAKIQASTTSVTANVQNVFDGMKMTLEAGGQEFEAYVKSVAAETVVA